MNFAALQMIPTKHLIYHCGTTTCGLMKYTVRVQSIRGKSGWSHGPPIQIIIPYQGSIDVGKLARLANGSAVAKNGDTSVLVTVVGEPFNQPTDGSFLPLTVNYRQKAAATGRIPTNFLRREISQSNTEILTSRKIDRSLRPLFPEGFHAETQVSCSLVAFDRVHQPDVLAINAASAALSVSNIPWNGPVGAVRVGWLNDKPILNPDRPSMAKSKLDLIVTADCNSDIVMLEGSALELPHSQFRSALEFGAHQAAKVSKVIKKLRERVGPNKVPVTVPEENVALKKWLISNYKEFLIAVYTNSTHDKHSRDNARDAIKSNAVRAACEEFSSLSRQEVTQYFDDLSKNVIRELILTRGRRPDGRSFNELRSVSCEVDIHKPLHGSALFQRGQSQVMASVTLDSIASMSQTDPVAEILVGRPEKNFMLHYEFPQYATGDIGTGGGINRREIGHGALAEKGLRPVIPEDFPFTTRVSAEVLESAGSTSMASICAGSLALMDAGVPISRPAAGVAMGLVTKQNTDVAGGAEYALLTDIMGLEDYAGDVDFKMAGTCDGLTAVQADVKLPGVKLDIMLELHKRAIKPINTLLSIMTQCLRSHRVNRKDNWPISEKYTVPIRQRSQVIGVGGLNIKRIQSVTGVTISSNEDLSFDIFASNTQSLEAAKQMLNELIESQGPELELEFGNVYTGKIVELQPAGALVLIHANKPPVFVRNSQLDLKKVYHSEAVGLPVGETIHIKYFGNDPVTGEERWSRRALLTAGGFSKRLLPHEDAQSKVFYQSPAQINKNGSSASININNSHTNQTSNNQTSPETVSNNHMKSGDT